MVGFSSKFRPIAAFLSLVALASVPALAQTEDAPPQGLPNPGEKSGHNLFDYTAPDKGVPKDLATRVGIDQKMDGRLPLNLQFKDEAGKPVTLGQYFGHRPVMISMLQLTCDQVCSAQFSAMTAAFNNLKFNVGQEFDVLTVSIDPREGPLIAQDVKDERLKEYTRPSAKQGWHFLTGDEKNIRTLAKALGIKYIWDKGSGQFIHPDGLIVVTPDGRISRYFVQLTYHPRDLQFSVMEASKERIGSVIDQIALSCFHYNPVEGRYSLQVMALVQVLSVALVLGGLTAIFLMVSLEKKRGRGKNVPPIDSSQLKKA